jgi:hypothetical protein
MLPTACCSPVLQTLPNGTFRQGSPRLLLCSCPAGRWATSCSVLLPAQRSKCNTSVNWVCITVVVLQYLHPFCILVNLQACQLAFDAAASSKQLSHRLTNMGTLRGYVRLGASCGICNMRACMLVPSHKTPLACHSLSISLLVSRSLIVAPCIWHSIMCGT